MSTFPDLTSRRGILDFLLAQVVLALQLSETQLKRVESAYAAIGQWLERADSPLAPFRPLIFPQGSVALGTTVHPWTDLEFDLDFVLEVAFFPGTPMELYELLYKRLAAHGTYAGILQRMRRCVRVVYEGEFHVDIMPARTANPLRVPGALEIPDRRDPLVWRASNPRGFAAWFEGRARTAAERLVVAKQLPLPADLGAAAKTVLQRIVQLPKRNRDVVFGASELAPRSVILTTLLATFYDGEVSVSEALANALSKTCNAVDAVHPNRLRVLNPVNAEEDFSETWSDPKAYRAFTTWVRSFEAGFRALQNAQGLEEVTRTLAKLFGEDVSMRATHEYQKAFAEARRTEQLRAVGPTIITSGVGRKIPPNRNYGRDEP